MLNKVSIFGAGWCSYCIKAKDLAEANGFEITLQDVDDEDVKKIFKNMFPNEKKIPQIILNGRHIGGYDSLVNEIENIQDGGVGEGAL